MNWNSIRSMDAYTRHRWYINNYVLPYGKKAELLGEPATVRTDFDVLRDNHRFIRDDDEDAKNKDNWEVRQALKYYNKLYREYCIADMSRYKEGKIAMRWRVEKEVISGKGHFVCGCKSCDEHRGLRSYEVNFAYKEEGERKNALVKLRLCPRHGFQLHYRKYKQLSREEYKAVKRKAEEAMKNGGYAEDLAAQAQARSEANVERDRQHKREQYLESIRHRGDARGKDEPQEQPRKRARGEMAALERTDAEEQAAAISAARAEEDKMWSEKPKEEKTKADEFDDYFSGMFP